MNKTKKKVSVLIPCRNEAHNIESCLQNVYEFDSPEGGYEVIVIDGMSDDGTKEILLKLMEQYSSLTVIDNPKKTVPHAMNLGILKANGEYIIRTDVRCIHPKTYLVDLISLSQETNADNVGGVLIPIGNTYIQRSIALAYHSPIAMGGALRNREDFVGESDAVYGGCFRKSRLLEVGMYDETMVRNQDDELSFRLKKLGGTIIQSAKVKVKYFPRKQFDQLFKQFLQYGYWKVAVLKKNPGQVSWRHFAPALLVTGLSVLSIGSLFSSFSFIGLTFFGGAYLLILLLESLRLAWKHDLKSFPGIVTAIGIIHMSFGIGFIAGMLNRVFFLKAKLFETLSR